MISQVPDTICAVAMGAPSFWWSRTFIITRKVVAIVANMIRRP